MAAGHGRLRRAIAIEARQAVVLEEASGSTDLIPAATSGNIPRPPGEGYCRIVGGLRLRE